MAEHSITSAAEIAYRLLYLVAFAEEKALSSADSGTKPDRAWILTAYRECLFVASGEKPPIDWKKLAGPGSP